MKLKQLEHLKNLLPVIPGINGRKERFSSAILVLLVFFEGEYHFVFEKRSAQVSQGGEVCFPGGKIEPEDRNSEETALRETVEELGIAKDKITILGRLDTLVAPLGDIIEAYVGIVEITKIEDLKFAHEEVEYVFTVPVSFFEQQEPEIYQAMIQVHPTYLDKEGKEVQLFPAAKLGLPEMYHSPWGGRKYNIYLYKVKGEVIWGITARFIFDIIDKLKQNSNDEI